MDDFQSLIWGINTIYSHGYHGSYSYARMWDAQREARWISWGCSPPTTPSPPASRYSPCFLLVVPHSQYTISPVGQGLQGRGIFLHILVPHDIRMNICTNIWLMSLHLENPSRVIADLVQPHTHWHQIPSQNILLASKTNPSWHPNKTSSFHRFS